MSPLRLSVVICSLGRESATTAVGSARRALDLAGLDGNVVLVWQGREDPPALPAGVTVHRMLPAGAAHGRNAGTAASDGDWLGFVDDDEVVDEMWATGLAQGAADGADAVLGPVDPMDGPGRPYCALSGDLPRWVARGERPWSAGTGGNIAVSRAEFERLRGFHPRLGPGAFGRSADDTHLIARLLRTGARVRWRPEMRVAHPRKRDEEILASRAPYGFGAARMARELRAPDLAALYAFEIGQAARAVARRDAEARLREVAATARGFAAGVLARDRSTAPLALLERAPAEIRTMLAGEVRGWPLAHGPVPHFVYAVGRDRLLHVYADGARAEALEARAALAADGGPAGVPRVVAAAESGGGTWVVEERLAGRPARPDAHAAWWPSAARLLAAVGSSRGEPLGDGRWFAQHGPALRAAGPEVAAALDAVASLPGVVVHGDAQPKNVLVDGSRIALVDWDGAVPDGPPGMDLLFLATTARWGRPDTEPLRALARGRDLPGLPLRAALAAAGVPPEAVAPLALVAVASWREREAARGRRLGAVGPADDAYAALAAAVLPALAAAQWPAATSA